MEAMVFPFYTKIYKINSIFKEVRSASLSLSLPLSLSLQNEIIIKINKRKHDDIYMYVI
jgi:hypothetical protein|tara:strand:- start:223 stop:399 length:177 start_codon:yes stop_codon:yes gene_type:complete